MTLGKFLGMANNLDKVKIQCGLGPGGKFEVFYEGSYGGLRGDSFDQDKLNWTVVGFGIEDGVFVVEILQ